MDKKNLSVDELIEAAKKTPITVNDERLTLVEQFILDNNVTENLSTPVPAMNIYWIYYKWCEFKGIKRLNKVLFFKQFGKIFKKKLIVSDIHYFVNKEPFDLTMDEWWEMRKVLRMQKEARDIYKEYVKERKEKNSKK